MFSWPRKCPIRLLQAQHPRFPCFTALYLCRPWGAGDASLAEDRGGAVKSGRRSRSFILEPGERTLQSHKLSVERMGEPQPPGDGHWPGQAPALLP